jgi:hypothetical protein
MMAEVGKEAGGGQVNGAYGSVQLRETIAAKAGKQRARKRANEKIITRPEGFRVKGGIKSRDRVQELAEVFTAEREVRAMLDLLGDVSSDIRARFLEPACGNGNFLEEIVARKLTAVTATAKTQDDFEFQILMAISSTYGIDISEENVIQARARIRALVVHCYSTARNTWRPRSGFYSAVDRILETNIVVGDSLNGAEAIVLIEYSSPAPLKFARRFFTLGELEKRQGGNKFVPQPFKVVGAKHYLEIDDGS